MARLPRPCLNCGALTTNSSRCDPCRLEWQRTKDEGKPPRPHYQGNYRARAKQVRDTAEVCWLCGEGARPGDPWTADHVIPHDTAPDTPLLPAHRSCNSRRRDGNR